MSVDLLVPLLLACLILGYFYWRFIICGDIFSHLKTRNKMIKKGIEKSDKQLFYGPSFFCECELILRRYPLDFPNIYLVVLFFIVICLFMGTHCFI